MTATARLDRETGVFLETSPIDFYVDKSVIHLLGDLSDAFACLPATHPSLLAAAPGSIYEETVIPRFSMIVRIPEITVDLLHLIKLSVEKVGVGRLFHVVFSPNKDGHPLAGNRPFLS